MTDQEKSREGGGYYRLGYDWIFQSISIQKLIIDFVEVLFTVDSNSDEGLISSMSSYF